MFKLQHFVDHRYKFQLEYFLELAGFSAIFSGAYFTDGTSLNAIFHSQNRHLMPQHFAVYITLGHKRDMHKFHELVQRSTAFSLSALDEAQQRTIDALQTSAATTLVKTLQMVQLQKAISAVGMFSMFDAILQNQLQCRDGFKEAGKILENQGEIELKEIFSNLQLAVNVLKHGKGRSYNDLVEKAATLPFRIKLPDEYSFNEGDVSEISTLVEVDDAFVLLSAEVIHAVSVAVQGNS